MKKHYYKVFQNGNLCSEHKTLTGAEKMIRRLVAMSNGKKTEKDFEIKVDILN